MGQNSTMSIKLFDFLFFMRFFGFLTHKKKGLIKSNNITTTKANKAINIQQNHAIQKANKVVCAPTQTKLTHCKWVKHTSHKRFKELYWHQWSYGGIQTVDHREAWWRCPPFDCQGVWIQDTQLFLYQISNEMVTYLYVFRFWMLDRIFGKIDGTGIVTKDTHRLLRNSIIMK